MERIPLDWLMEIPPVTRTYFLGVVSVSLLDYIGYLGKVDSYYSIDTVFHKGEYWRLLTSFLYFGNLTFDLAITLYGIVRHSKSLELSFPHTRDYIWCVLLLSISLLLYSSLVSNLFILGTYLNDTLLFIWSRRNPDVELTIMGLLTFRSVYLPFVSLIISKLLNISSAGSINPLNGDWKADLAGIIIGQSFIFLSDIYPRLHNCPSPIRPIWYWFQEDNNDEEEIQLDDTDTMNVDEENLPVDEVPRVEIQQEGQLLHDDSSINEEIQSIVSTGLDPETIQPINNSNIQYEDDGRGLRQRDAD